LALAHEFVEVEPQAGVHGATRQRDQKANVAERQKRFSRLAYCLVVFLPEANQPGQAHGLQLLEERGFRSASDVKPPEETRSPDVTFSSKPTL
jgi:hypothetical protein